MAIERPTQDSNNERKRGRACIWLAAAALSLFAVGCAREAEAPTAPTPQGTAIPVAAIEIQPRDLSRQLTLSGTVEARVSIRLASRIAGAVETVRVEEGGSVEQGEVMATLDMAEALAELARARAEERLARLEHRRSSELRTRGVLSEAQYELAQVALQVAESEHALWRTRVEYGTIVSPLKAVVTARYIEPGEAVQAQATLFELAALDDLVIRFGVSELDVVHITPGMNIPIRLDALPALELQGAVRRVFPVAQSGSRLVTVEVALPADAIDHGVRPGFLARMRAVIDNRPDALVVPAASVGVDRNETYVYAIADGKLERRRIEVGVTRGQWTEVLSGLSVGDIVLASNPIEMRADQPVRIVAMRNGPHAH